MKKFLGDHLLAISIYCMSLLVFTSIFVLLNLPLYGLSLGIGLLTFLTIILLGVKYLNYQKQENLKEAYRQLKVDFKNLKLANSENYQNLEDYFILWMHQIKTPITAAKLLAEDQKQTDMKQLLLEIENYSQLAMSFLKLNDPVADLNIEAVVIDDLIRPLLRKYSSQFIRSKTQLTYEKISDSIITDANWTQMMIEQLLNNALKYAAGKTIHIYYENGQLVIEDTGMGIGSQDLPKIFDKGYSGFNGKLNEKSTGLGLFIVESISQRLNHPIKVESRLKEGTRFFIEFPEKSIQEY